MPTLMSTQDLRLGYGGKTVLSGVCMHIECGQFWFILGPNGHGKSTLLRALMGLLPPQGGQLHRDPHHARLDTTGFVPQRCDFNPSLSTTVREFVSLGLVGLSVKRSDEQDRLAWALERVGMSSHRHRDYASLSGGQRQRSLLARALVRRPTLLILDEPTNGLDLNSEEDLLSSLQRLNRDDGMTILFVTHDLPLAARFATHLALVHRGSVESGPAAHLLGHGALERTYGMAIPWAIAPLAGKRP
jgi:ABC-type Mn2+/Zn2+ transport system ATPase subunit